MNRLPFQKYIWPQLLLLLALAPVAWAEPATSFHPGEIWPDNNGVHINAHAAASSTRTALLLVRRGQGRGRRRQRRAQGVHVYSSTDLYNWKDEGIALSTSADPKSDIVEGCIIERPKVLYNAKTKKYVMWFHLEMKGQATRRAQRRGHQRHGHRPYTFVNSFRPDGEMSRDMTLFQDDDGKAYLVCASEENATTHISQLTDDYLNTTGHPVKAFKWWSEAPAVFKYNGKYFYLGSHCSGWAPNAAMSAEADSMLGPWHDLGDPSRGTPEQNKTTFESQSTYVLPVAGKPGAFIFMADRWRPDNAIDGRYVWLPIQFGKRQARPEVAPRMEPHRLRYPRRCQPIVL